MIITTLRATACLTGDERCGTQWWDPLWLLVCVERVGNDEKGEHKVYKMLTRIDQNLNATSYPHPAQKFGILSHLLQVNMAYNILNKVQLQRELTCFR
jgi:hypothetical protein